MSKFFNYRNKGHFTKFRELDDFIQNSLDKYFFVEPWKKLYDNTSIFSKYIISNKSTIPDLIIFNKTFNKNDCFYGANRNYFNKFPRLRFILRPRYKKFYNPCDTIGNDDEIYKKIKNLSEEKKLRDNLNNDLNTQNKYMKPLKKYIPEEVLEDGLILSKLSPDNIFETNNNNTNKDNLNNNNNKNNNLIKNEEINKNENNKKENNLNLDNQIFENKIPLNKENKTNEEQYDDEDEPEWENDDVTNYTTRVKFQEIPQDLKEKAEKEIDKREKIDVYNNNVLQTLNEPIKENNNENNNNNNNNLKEEVIKFDEKKEGNIFEELENFLKSDEKNTNDNKNNFFDNYNNNDSNNKYQINNNNFNKNKKKNYYNNNVNNINQNLKLQNMQLRYQIQQQQAQQAQLQQLYYLQQQQYLNYIQMQNIQNQMMNGLYVNNPNYYQKNPMINMNMNMNFNLNNNQNVKNLENNNNINNNVNNDDNNEEEDPMMNDFTTDIKYYNPTVFLENPALIVKKNLIEKNWFLMRDGKILGNYNSEELLFLLDEKIKEGNNFNNISISDYQTDVVFQPKILYEILKEHVSKIKKKYLESKLNQTNNSNTGSSPFANLNENNNLNQLFN